MASVLKNTLLLVLIKGFATDQLFSSNSFSSEMARYHLSKLIPFLREIVRNSDCYDLSNKSRDVNHLTLKRSYV